MIPDQHDVSHVVGRVEAPHSVADHQELHPEELHDTYGEGALPERVALQVFTCTESVSSVSRVSHVCRESIYSVSHVVTCLQFVTYFHVCRVSVQ